MVARFTPTHLDVLAHIADGKITWRTNIGPSGGFAKADGTRIPPSDVLVALYQLHRAALIHVDNRLT